jgi:hypothetical protein
VTSERIAAHLEVAGLIRAVQAAGGFATVLATGERDAGTILVVCYSRAGSSAAYERMPQADGTRRWTLSRKQDAEKPQEFSEYCRRRHEQDRDLWVVELDIPDAERFIDSMGTLN